MELKDRITELRKIKGMTQKELAKEIGVTIRSVQHYESGDRIPGTDTVARIARALGIREKDLCSGEYHSDSENSIISGKAAGEKLIGDAAAFFRRSDISDAEKEKVLNSILDSADIICKHT